MGKPRKKTRFADRLTIKQRKFVNQYVKTGVAKNAVLTAYDTSEKNACSMGTVLLKKEKIQNAIDVALAKAGFDEDFAAGTLKTVVEEGKMNLDKTRPSDVISALKLYHQIKGDVGDKNKSQTKQLRDQLRDMSIGKLKEKLDELNKRQEKLTMYLENKIEEGEVVDK